ncbi:MAG: GGDEF domain-containing protein [Proteobacteria bacterium]|nr:GGDEF domain-containing protein [Pseudomonadota bacterium]
MQTLLRRLLIGFALAVACAGASAWAFPGEPLLQRFTPVDFKATPYLYGVARDAQGRVYVGNTDGVLRMQGREWETIPLPGGMAAGYLARGTDGRVYLSGYDSFGYIDTAGDGTAVYHDLRDAFGLTGAARALGWMQQIVPVAGGVYFRAQRQMLYYGFDGRRKIWPMPEADSGFSAWQGMLYTLDMKAGLRRFADGQLVPVPGGQIMSGHRGVEIVDRGKFALAISVGGFYRLDEHGVSALAVPPIPADAGIFSAVAPLRGGGFVVSTQSGNLLEYDADAHLLARYPIARTGITALATDGDDGLWACSDDELLRLQLPSTWSRVDTGELGGVIADAEIHRGALWLAVGVRGLARMTDRGGQLHTDWIAGEHRNQIFALRSTADGLLLARAGGIDVIGDDDRVDKLLDQDDPAYALVASRYDPDLMYAPGDAGVYVLRRADHHWKLAGLMPAPELASQSLLEVAPGVLWVNNTRGLPERWQVDPIHARILKRERFALTTPGAAHDPNQATQIYALGADVFVGIGEHVYRFDGRGFAPFAGEPFSLMQNPNAFQLLNTPLGAFAATGSRLYWQRSKGHWQRLDFGAQPVASQSLLRYGTDGVLRMGVWRALLQYRPEAATPTAPPPLVVRLTAVQRTQADGTATRLPIQANGADSFTQSQSLSLHFTVFSPEPGVEYRYRIRGLTGSWSEWREQSLLALSSLDQPGDYTVEIEGRTPSGRAVEPAQYPFSIAPRWYQINTVRLLLLLAGLLLLWGVIRWREHRQARVFAQRQQLLEGQVAARTSELEAANRKLAELATEDPLTGVANRRALEIALQREWQRCLDQRIPIALLMIDVDHFKDYNDRHGHPAGDAVLKAVAERLAVGVQPQREMLARYGGEEFCLLLPATDTATATARAEQLRRSFEAADSVVTVSIGVAVRVPILADSAQALLRTADERLYAAKRGGRNRVEIDAG